MTAITGEERDALYGQLLDRLSAIGDIEVAIESKNYGIADRIGREYTDDLRLLLDDLGLGERGRDEQIELSSPPDLLLRVLPRLRKAAERNAESLDPELSAAEAMRKRDRLVSEACTAVLDELDGSGAGTEGRTTTEGGRMRSEPPIFPRGRPRA